MGISITSQYDATFHLINNRAGRITKHSSQDPNTVSDLPLQLSPQTDPKFVPLKSSLDSILDTVR